METIQTHITPSAVIRKLKWLSFWAGWLTCTAVNSLRQDWMGKKAFLAHAEERWLSAAISVPVAIACALLAFWLLTKPYPRFPATLTDASPPEEQDHETD